MSCAHATYPFSDESHALLEQVERFLTTNVNTAASRLLAPGYFVQSGHSMKRESIEVTQAAFRFCLSPVGIPVLSAQAAVID